MKEADPVCWYNQGLGHTPRPDLHLWPESLACCDGESLLVDLNWLARHWAMPGFQGTLPTLFPSKQPPGDQSQTSSHLPLKGKGPARDHPFWCYSRCAWRWPRVETPQMFVNKSYSRLYPRPMESGWGGVYPVSHPSTLYCVLTFENCPSNLKWELYDGETEAHRKKNEFSQGHTESL